jgi:hypothetical protein
MLEINDDEYRVNTGEIANPSFFMHRRKMHKKPFHGDNMGSIPIGDINRINRFDTM